MSAHGDRHGAHGDRHGAKQPERFDPARRAMLDDRGRFAYVPPERLLGDLELAQGATLLDFGTGTALYAIALAELRPDLRIVALDEQPQMLEHARDACARAGVTNVEVADPSALQALSGRLDGVLALNVLHEIGDDALRDLRELFTADGRALFVDWNADVERPVGPPRDHVYGVADARTRLEAAAMRVEERAPLPYHYVMLARRAG